MEKAEADYRREFLPPPSREKPRHDPASVTGAQALERLSKGIGALATLVNTQPVPENKRMTQRSRQEAPRCNSSSIRTRSSLARSSFYAA